MAARVDVVKPNVVDHEPNGVSRQDAAPHLQVGSGAAARSAGAYGGSEVGAIVGGMVGPPVIGGIVGGIVGEMAGADAVSNMGLDQKAKKVSDKMEKIIGKNNTEKVAEITMTALGYSITETCICCPCLPASQIMYFVVLAFFVFNCYRLAYGLDHGFGDGNQNGTGLNFTSAAQLLSEHHDSQISEYLIVGAAVWIAFLPFYLFTLFGNCWRQCCCCLCDPVVCCATAMDFLRRCLCECGKFSFIHLIWYSMCLFQIGWAVFGCYTLGLAVSWPVWSVNSDLVYLFAFVVASIILDVFLSGSEIVHKIYHDKLTRDQKEIENRRKEDSPATGNEEPA